MTLHLQSPFLFLGTSFSIPFSLVSSHPHHPCGIGDISESGDQTLPLTHIHTHTVTLITEQQLESEAVLILFLLVNGIMSFN